MIIAIRYQSRNGNTKAAAEAIAEVVGVAAKAISEPLDGPVDLLFIGGPVYGLKVDSSLKDFVGCLDVAKVKRIAAFSTAGSLKTAINVIKKIANEKNIPVCEEALFLKMGLHLGGKLNDAQWAQARSFAKRIVES